MSEKQNDWLKFVFFPVSAIFGLCFFALCRGFDGHMLMAAVGAIAAITGFRYGVKWGGRGKKL